MTLSQTSPDRREGATASDADTPAPRSTCNECPALRIITMPKDTNNYGTVFGGVILSYLDQAGFVEARKHGVHRWVTVAMDSVVFHAPVRVGDIVNFFTSTIRTGTTSVKVGILVQVERFESGDLEIVTEAQMTFVAVDGDGNPIAFANPPTASLGDPADRSG